MKKLFYLAFCLAVAACLGCTALTYPCITDVGCDNNQSNFMVNTNGKAHVEETTHVSVNTGAKEFEHVAFIDQSAGGNQNLTTYECAHAAGSSNFHSDTYCNPDWTGCAWLTNNYACSPAPPCSFGAAGVSINYNCLDISAVGLCYSSRIEECGRSYKTYRGMTATEWVSLLNSMTETPTGVSFNLNGANTGLTMRWDNGAVAGFKLGGNYFVDLNTRKARAEVNLGPNHFSSTIPRFASLLNANGTNFVMTTSWGGVTRDINVSALDPSFYLKSMAKNG